MLFKKFWLKTSQLVFWDNKPQKALKKKNKHYVEWFPDGKLNIFHNCININILRGLGNKIAIYKSSYITCLYVKSFFIKFIAFLDII